MATATENQLDKYPKLKEWLAEHGGPLVWSISAQSTRLGPIQMDCWYAGDGQLVILYWPTGWDIYTASPVDAPDTDEAKLADATARITATYEVTEKEAQLALLPYGTPLPLGAIKLPPTIDVDVDDEG